MRCGFDTGWMKLWREVLRQRNAMLALPVDGAGRRRQQRLDALQQRFAALDQAIKFPTWLYSGLRKGGRSRFQVLYSALMVTYSCEQVAGPDHAFGDAAVQDDADRDFAFLHDALPVLLAVARRAAAAFRHQNFVEVKFDAVDVEVADAGVADRGPAAGRDSDRRRKMRSSPEASAQSRRQLSRTSGSSPPFSTPDGDEFGRAPLAVAHDRLGEPLRKSLSPRRPPGPRIPDRPARRARPPRTPVAMSMKASLVEVSPSTLARLKERAAASEASRCNACGVTGASVAMNPQHGRHVGPYHARALGDPGHRCRAVSEGVPSASGPWARCR